MSTAESLQPGNALPTAPAVVRERPGGETMRAIALEKFGGLDSLVYTDIPKPQPKDGEVVIKVRGFGVNHAELHMRRGEWAEAAEVSGIECVGIVDACPGGEVSGRRQGRRVDGWPRANHQRQLRGIHPGTRGQRRPHRVRSAVVAVGGTPRNVCDSVDMPVPQSQSVCGTNHCHPRRDFIVRPGRGQDGSRCRCTRDSTARKRERFGMLEALGVARAELESPTLAASIAEAKQIDAVLDLVGNSTILDSLDMLRRDGTACLAGWLGGLDPIGDFNPLLRMASGVNWSFFGSFVFGSPGFPLSDVPLQDIAAQVAAGQLDAALERVFSFDEIRDAHRIMEAGEAGGKMVVVVQ